MSKIIDFVIPYDEDLHEYLNKNYPDLNYVVRSRSLDARKAPKGRKPRVHYRVELSQGKIQKKREELKSVSSEIRPIIVGAGPAGLFCALRLKDYGVKSTLIERGERAQDRMRSISQYWRRGIFNPESNVCFGEGGAGLFSDGKLYTRVKSDFVSYVLQRLVDFGAPESILFESNPHLGSNKIRELIGRVSDELLSFGCEVLYQKRVDEILEHENQVLGIKSGEQELHSPFVVLATGHSADHIYQNLSDLNVNLSQKSFAVGVRVEHPRKHINKIQYGNFSEDDRLGAARYRVSYFDQETKRGTYSFCMCPGGYVLSSGTEHDGLVTNGMSNFAHNSPWSNSAIVVTVDKDNDFDESDSLAGLRFQREIEKKAYELSKNESNGYALPAMTMKEFLAEELSDLELPKTSCPSKVFKADLKKVFPPFVYQHLKQALIKMNEKLPGYYYDNALVIAPETRTSAPLTILRNAAGESSLAGLYPCGEGAGYAGGITSAAVDGVKIAESIIKRINS